MPPGFEPPRSQSGATARSGAAGRHGRWSRRRRSTMRRWSARRRAIRWGRSARRCRRHRSSRTIGTAPSFIARSRSPRPSSRRWVTGSPSPEPRASIPEQTCKFDGGEWPCGVRARTAVRLWLRGRALVLHRAAGGRPAVPRRRLPARQAGRRGLAGVERLGARCRRRSLRDGRGTGARRPRWAFSGHRRRRRIDRQGQASPSSPASALSISARVSAMP